MRLDCDVYVKIAIVLACSVWECAMHYEWELSSPMSVELQMVNNSTFGERVY